MAHITEHAIDRWQQRVNPAATRDEARAAMLASSKAIDCAARFGARVVRLGIGAKLVLQDDVVVTVLERGKIMAGFRAPAGRA